jgi:hypothetical protein
VSAPFAVAPGLWAARTPSHLTAVALRQTDDGWAVVLGETRNSLTFPVGTSDWTVSEPEDDRGSSVPVAAAGGWWDAHTFRAAVVFLETPHRLELTLSLASRSAAAVWNFAPLAGDRIADLHCP